MNEPHTSIGIGDTIQCLEDNWQGRVTAFDVHDGVTMIVCHHYCGEHKELDDKRWFDPRDVRLLRKATFVADLIQFMRPDGDQKPVTTDLPIEVEPFYKDMLAHGCRLECELLRTSEVSVTVSDGETDLDFSVTPNHEGVHQGMVDMLKRQCWLQLKQAKESS